ncbi:pilus assembly PilX family protein [Lysobacter enzymogenes]|uniref:pilus assembly PilX family protein n=1 Tax=Lysobacter enzymogenes TaxID=69 RepID=UPI000BBB3E56|nr:PilX N-terminal domain-containing pilus assembly protein [Lysobacter enzymogenes]
MSTSGLGRSGFRSRGRQRGAVLYVALTMLILLALLGLVGMKVSGLQERMSANYSSANAAFQGAERVARVREAQIQSSLFGGSGVYEADQEMCAPPFDPMTWSDPTSNANSEDVYTRRIDKCFAGSSIKLGVNKSEETSNIYQVSAIGADRKTGATSTAVIDTVFIP